MGPSTRKIPPRPLWRDFFEVCLVAVLCASFTRTFVAQPFKIPSASMEKTLLVGDHLLVNKFIYAALRDGPDAGSPPFFLPMRPPRRGEVVVFEHPQQHRPFIKRCLGLPGETVEIAGRSLRVDGQEIDDSRFVHYSHPAGSSSPTAPPQQRFEIPADAYFCLGDHRDRSSDSRHWGLVPGESVRGRAVLVYWSFAPAPHPAGEWSIIERLGGWISRSRLERCFRWVR